MISYQDFQKKSEYSSFIKENSEVGSLKINVFAASARCDIFRLDRKTAIFSPHKLFFPSLVLFINIEQPPDHYLYK